MTVLWEWQKLQKDDQGRMKNMIAMKEIKDLPLEMLSGHVSKIIL